MFSCPAVVWTANVQQDGGEQQVEESEDHADDRRQNDDHLGGLHQLFLRGPAHLPHLRANRGQEIPRAAKPLHGPAAAPGDYLGVLHYFDSLCSTCFPQ